MAETEPCSLARAVDQFVEVPACEANTARASRTGGSALLWTMMAVVVAETLYVAWIAARGYFYQDDFVDLQLTKQLGLDGRLLEQPIFGHFIPGYTFVDFIVSSITPYRWQIVEATDVLLVAASLLLLYRLLVNLLGATWITVALVVMAGASFSLVPSLVWWASGLQFVAIPASILAIDGQVRFLQTGRVRHVVFGGIALTVALAFYDGAVSTALFVLLMTLLIWPAGPGFRGATQVLVRYWPAWICFGIPVAFDLGWRFTHHAL